MPYATGEIANKNTFSSIMEAFFTSYPNNAWRLVRHSEQDRFVVSHKRRDLSISFILGKINAWDSNEELQVGVGGTYSGGAWPGIMDFEEIGALGNGGQRTIRYPAKYHILCSDSYFYIFINRLSDGKSASGGYIALSSVHDPLDVSAFVQSAVNNESMDAVAFQEPSMYFSSGGTMAREVAAAVRINDTWRPVGAKHYPYITACYRHPSYPHHMACYDDSAISQMVFEKSLTTVFLPFVVAVRQGGSSSGFSLEYEAPDVRICPMRFYGAGDSIEYQGRKWLVFYRSAVGSNGVAFRLPEGD